MKIFNWPARFNVSDNNNLKLIVSRQLGLKKCIFGAAVISALFFSIIGNAQVSFNNVTSIVGPFHTGESWGAAWGDINGDYYPDIAANNHTQRHSLWLNQAGANFEEGILQFDLDREWTGDVKQDSHGTTFADIDNDGDQELLGTRSSRGYRIQLFVNDQGRAHEEAVSRGLGGVGGGRSSAFYDYNRDGILDFFHAAQGGWANRVYTGDGNSFINTTPVDFQVKCPRIHYFQFSDIDNDTSGLQNLDVACIVDSSFPQALFDLSSGDTNFVEISQLLPASSNTLDTVFADFDNDGDNDVFSLRGGIRRNGASLTTPNRIEASFASSTSTGTKSFTFGSSENTITITDLWVSRDSTPLDQLKIGSLSNIVTALPLTLNKNSLFAQGVSDNTEDGAYIGFDTVADEWVVQFRSEGHADYYLILEGTGLTPPTDFEMSVRDLPLRPLLTRNTNNGFEHDFDIGIEEISCTSVAAGDLDNDMDIDLYLACGGGVENHPNQIYLNDGTGNFTALTTHGAEGVIGAGLEQGAGLAESVVVADYDIDGRLDFFTTNGGWLIPQDEGGPDELFRNTTQNTNNWIELDLVGTSVNRDGIGAKVIALTGGVTQFREQNGGYHRWSQNHKRIHFGLGSNPSVTIIVIWPDGTQDVFAGLVGNSLYELTQGQSAQAIVPGAYNTYPAPQAGEECSSRGQAYSADLDRGLFLYKDCDLGSWHLRAVAGGSEQSVNFTGHIISGDPIISSTPISLEGSDFVNHNGRRIDFSLTMSGVGEDGFDFELFETSGACIQIDSAEKLFVGDGHLEAPVPLNLTQMGLCDLNPDGSLNVPQTTSVSITTQAFNIPGNGGSSFQTIDLSASGIEIGSTVVVSEVLAEGDLNDSSDMFSLNINSNEYIASSLTTGNLCSGSLQTLVAPISQSVTVIDIGGGVPGIIIFGTTSTTVNDVCNDVQYVLTISASVVDTDYSALACGEPTYSSTSDKGLFVWRDCDGSGDWFVRATAGGEAVATTYEAVMSASSPISSVTTYSFEGVDNFQLLNLDKQLDFTMKMSGSGQDGLQYSLAADAELCLTLADSNQVIYIGAQSTPLTSPANLISINNNCGAAAPEVSVADIIVSETAGTANVVVSLSAVSSQVVSVVYGTTADTAEASLDFTHVSGQLDFQPGETSKIVSIPILQDSEVEQTEYFSLVLSSPLNAEVVDPDGQISIDDDEIEVCGEPSYKGYKDAGIFIWQDCGNTDKWLIRATAGGGSAIIYSGTVTSDLPLLQVSSFSFEGIDNVELSNGNKQLDFVMRMANAGVDGVEFLVPSGAACIDLALPVNQPIVVGQNNMTVSSPFNLFTLDPC